MDKDELIQCPYNKSHSILSSRMQFHLMKCRLQYPNLPKTTCLFNSTHIVNKVELEYHCEYCPDRIVVDSYFYSIGPDPEVERPMVSKIEPLEITGEELWDDTAPRNVLETVQESCKTRLALQTVVGVSKSERKAFRHQQRLKAAYLTNNTLGGITNEHDQAGSSGVGKEKKDMGQEANSGHQNNANKRGQTYRSDSDQSVDQQQARQTITGNASGAPPTLRRNLSNPWGTATSRLPNKENIAQRNECVTESDGIIRNQQPDIIRKVQRDPTNPWRSSLISSTSSAMDDKYEFPGLPVTARRQKGNALNKRNY